MLGIKRLGLFGRAGTCRCRARCGCAGRGTAVDAGHPVPAGGAPGEPVGDKPRYLAQQKGQDQRVKDLGAMLKTDHTQLDQTVQRPRQQLGVQLPNEPSADQQAVIDRLNNASGAEFDRRWVTSRAGRPRPGHPGHPDGDLAGLRAVGGPVGPDAASDAADALRRVGGPGQQAGHPGSADQRQRYAQPGRQPALSRRLRAAAAPSPRLRAAPPSPRLRAAAPPRCRLPARADVATADGRSTHAVDRPPCASGAAVGRHGPVNGGGSVGAGQADRERFLQVVLGVRRGRRCASRC